jgi:hypothetical protein
MVITPIVKSLTIKNLRLRRKNRSDRPALG